MIIDTARKKPNIVNTPANLPACSYASGTIDLAIIIRIARGFKIVGQIDGTNSLRFHAKQNGLAIAVELLSSHTSGAPIVDDTGKFIGFVSESTLVPRSSEKLHGQ